MVQYCGQLNNVQVAFEVKQKFPKTLDEATLELESYLHKLHSPNNSSIIDSSLLQVVAGVQNSQEIMMEMLTNMMERLDKLETT